MCEYKKVYTRLKSVTYYTLFILTHCLYYICWDKKAGGITPPAIII